VTEAEAHFELVEFEQVEAAPGTALLRVAGRPAAELPTGQLTLVIDDHGAEHRHEQLPALPGPPGLIRAAFSAPLEHVGPGATFALELPDGQLVRLPAPVRRRAALSAIPAQGAPVPGSDAAHQTRPGAEESGPEPSRLVEAERRAESRRLAIAELERRLQSERERRSAAESDLAHLRTERDEARAERDSALADRDEAVADRDQAEARARAAAANAGSLEGQIRAGADAATRVETALESQLADRVSELERMRSAAEVAQARAAASRREVTALDEQLAHAQAQNTVLQQSLEQRENEYAAARGAMDDEIAAARAETGGVRERVIALEDEIAAQRDLQLRTESQHTYDLDTAQSRIDAAHAETDAVRTELDALRHRSAELEATLAELDAALAKRAAEIELLRGALAGDGLLAPAAAAGDAGGLSGTELEERLAEARSEASSVLVAEVELLRAQVLEHGNNFEQAQNALRAAVTRAEMAEATAAKRAAELEEFGEKVREQITEVQRSRHELVSAAEATQHALEIEKARADTAEAKNRQLSEAVRIEAEKRVAAEEALVQGTAQHALTQETLSLEGDGDHA
jgi:chromosome segregation ATPase